MIEGEEIAEKKKQEKIAEDKEAQKRKKLKKQGEDIRIKAMQGLIGKLKEIGANVHVFVVALTGTLITLIVPIAQITRAVTKRWIRKTRVKSPMKALKKLKKKKAKGRVSRI